MKERVLILTSTITPPANAAGVSRLDPRQRLKDYEDALRFYLRFLDKELGRIIFVENSYSELGSLKRITQDLHAAQHVKFLSFDGNNFPVSYGRCYGEAMILDYAMSSDCVSGASEDVEYWKVTGRYKVLNFAKMIARRPKDAEFYIDLRGSSKPPWADLRVLSWSRRGYESVMRDIAPCIREDLDGYRPGEHVAFEEISRRLASQDVRNVTTWTIEPMIDGYRAYDGKNWMHGRQLAVFILRSLQRKFLKRVLV